MSDKNMKYRLRVFRSNKNIYAQIIDDTKGQTLVSASSLKLPENNCKTAKAVGKDLATKAKKKSISTVVFDRGRFSYKGRIKSLAEGVREEGLVF